MRQGAAIGGGDGDSVGSYGRARGRRRSSGVAAAPTTDRLQHQEENQPGQWECTSEALAARASKAEKEYGQQHCEQQKWNPFWRQKVSAGWRSEWDEAANLGGHHNGGRAAAGGKGSRAHGAVRCSGRIRQGAGQIDLRGKATLRCDRNDIGERGGLAGGDGLRCGAR